MATQTPEDGNQHKVGEQKMIYCRCGHQLLLRWNKTAKQEIYYIACPDCRKQFSVCASPPIGIYQEDGTGNWVLVDTQRG